jgi:hypothetical protein
LSFVCRIGLVEFDADPKQRVDDFNRKVPMMGGSSPKDGPNGFKICCITDWRGTFSRSATCEASDRDPQPEHPMKQEITRFIIFYVPHHGRTSRSNKKFSLITWRSLQQANIIASELRRRIKITKKWMNTGTT